MGLLGDIGNGISSAAGVFGIGGKANPNTYNLDDAAYEDYYNSALGDINNAYSAEDPQRAKINSSLSGMLGNLDNNAAGLKKNYEEDTSRSFGDAMQQRARSAGGTGNLAQALNPSGAALDAQARQTSRGYTDLYNTAVNQLGSLTNTEANLNDQSMQRGRDLAGLRMQRIGQRLGVATQDSANSRNADATGQSRLYNTIMGIGKGAGSLGGGGPGSGTANAPVSAGAGDPGYYNGSAASAFGMSPKF